MGAVKILVVDDERAVRESLRRALELEGYEIELAADGQEALQRLEGNGDGQPDAVILDVLMPVVDGLEVCRRIRRSGNRVPVLMLTARDEIENRVAGLDAGADDYVTKPFALEELVARVRALLRRRQGTGAPVLRVGNLELNPLTRTVKRGGQAIPLTAKEYALLEYLMRRPSVVLTRTMIAEHVWDFTFDLSSNVVDVYIKHLRDKLNEPGKASFIQTVRGVGYTVMDPGAVEA